MYQTDRYYKLLILGDIGVGKKSFAVRYTSGTFPINYKSITGCDVMMRNLRAEDGTTIKVNMWPISTQNGQPSYYRGAVGAFIMFDITRKETFESVSKWKNSLDSALQGVPIILLVNKSDLEGGEWLDEVAMQLYCKNSGFFMWCKISSKDGTHVEDVVHQMIRSISKNKKELYIEDDYKTQEEDDEDEINENGTCFQCCF